MKKQIKFLVVLIVIKVFSLESRAQQVPVLSQYFGNTSIYYPSASALNDLQKFSVVYRDQFSAQEGSPSFLALNYATRLNRRIGIGITVNHIKVGLTNQTEINPSLSWALLNLGNHRLSVGAEASFSDYGLNDRLLSAPAFGDPLLEGIGGKGLTLAIQAGLSYRYNSLAFDLLIPHMYNEVLVNEDWANFDAVDAPDFMAGLSYELVLDASRQISLIPNITVRHFHDLETEVDVLAKITYQDKFNVFGGIRGDYGAAFGFGYQIKSNIELTYNHDLGKSDVPFLSNGASEIALHFTFNHKEVLPESVLQYQGLAVRDSVDDHNIASPNFLSEEKRTQLYQYFLLSQPKGKKKKRQQQAHVDFDLLFEKQREEETARLQAEVNRKKAEQDANELSHAEKARLLEKSRQLVGKIESESKADLERRENEATTKKKAEETKGLELAQPTEKGTDISPIQVNEQLAFSYIIVVAAFEIEKNREGFLTNLLDDYPKARFLDRKNRGLDYVYVFGTNGLERAESELLKIRQNKKYAEAWIYRLNSEERK